MKEVMMLFHEAPSGNCYADGGPYIMLTKPSVHRENLIIFNSNIIGWYMILFLLEEYHIVFQNRRKDRDLMTFQHL